MNKIKRFSNGLLLTILALVYIMISMLHYTPDEIQDHTSAALVGEIPPVSSIDQQIRGVNDSLPYYQYQKIKNNLLKKKDSAYARNAISTSFKIERLGISSKRTTTPTDDSISYYLSLQGYTIDAISSVYFDSGKTYLVSPVWSDSISAGNGKFIYTKGHWAAHPLKIGVNAEDMIDNESGIKEKEIQLPLSERVGSIIRYSTIPVSILIFFFLLYVSFVLPILIVQNIALGRIFTKETLERFSLLDLH